MNKKLAFTLIITIIFAGAFAGCSGSVNTGGDKNGKVAVKGRPADFKEGIWIKKYPGNQTCFKLETPDGVRIITDPCYMDEKVKADIVTESNNHIDHTDTSRITGDYKLIFNTGRFKVKGVTVTGFSGVNNKLDNNESNIIYVFDIDGIRIAQFASQGMIPKEDVLKQIGNVDVLIIQLISDYTKIMPQEGKAIVERLKPKIIIPAHGDQTLDNDFAQLLDTEVEYFDSRQIVVTKDELGETDSPRVVVLDSDYEQIEDME